MTNAKALAIIRNTANRIWADSFEANADVITLARRMSQTAGLILAEIDPKKPDEAGLRLTTTPASD